MAGKDKNASTPEVSVSQKTEETAQIVEQLVVDSTPVVEAATPRRFRNVSATLLTKDDSSPFPSGSVTELSEAEITRFQQAKRQTGTTFIVEVKS
jgi:hypothetical protein